MHNNDNNSIAGSATVTSASAPGDLSGQLEQLQTAKTAVDEQLTSEKAAGAVLGENTADTTIPVY